MEVSHLKRIYQSGITGLLTLAVLLTTAFSGWAGTMGSISLEMSNSNITIHVYQIGTLEAINDQWQLARNNDFASVTFSLEDLDESNGVEEKRAKAAELAAFAIKNNVLVYQKGVSDGNGSLTFSDMEEGVYLIVKSNDTAANITIDPFFVTMPTQNQDLSGYEWNVTCKPKYISKNQISTTKSSSGGGSSSKVVPGSGSSALVNLPDENIPLADYYIEDDPVALTGLPLTGVTGKSVGVLLSLMGASIGGLIFLLYKKMSRN